MDWRSEAARPRPALAGGARIPVIARQSYSFPRRVFARVMQSRRPSLDERAQGKPGAECTRSLGATKKAHQQVHHRFSQSHRLSPHNGLTVSFVLSPVSGVFCHRCLRDTSRKIDATVAAPGPHDFAVRSFAVVALEESAAWLRPSHSGPTYVTIARYVPF